MLRVFFGLAIVAVRFGRRLCVSGMPGLFVVFVFIVRAVLVRGLRGLGARRLGARQVSGPGELDGQVDCRGHQGQRAQSRGQNANTIPHAPFPPCCEGTPCPIGRGPCR